MEKDRVFKRIRAPLTPDVIAELKAGDMVMISGRVYTARDSAHKRLYEALKRGEELPIKIDGEIIYYVGPTPARPGKAAGAAGPTTSERMDAFTPELLKAGLKGMIGKGARNQEVREAIKRYGAVYFAAIGGAGALISKSIKKVEMIAFEDLGPEAIRKMEVEDFPVIVINDIYGGDFYEEGISRYRRD